MEAALLIALTASSFFVAAMALRKALSASLYLSLVRKFTIRFRADTRMALIADLVTGIC